MDARTFASTRRKLLELVEALAGLVEEHARGGHGKRHERELLASMRSAAREAHELLPAVRAYVRASAPRCGAERARGGRCNAPAPRGGRCKLHGGPPAEPVEASPDVALLDRAQGLVSAAMSARATPRRRTSRYSPDLEAARSRIATLAQKRLAELRARAHAR